MMTGEFTEDRSGKWMSIQVLSKWEEDNVRSLSGLEPGLQLIPTNGIL